MSVIWKIPLRKWKGKSQTKINYLLNIPNEGLVCKIYKKFSQLNKKKKCKLEMDKMFK